MNKLVGINKVRDGVWHIAYDHHCGCGCTKKRYTLTHKQKNYPTDKKAQELIDEHYSKQ